MIAEADLIQRFFLGLGAERADVRLGIGDDAALLHVPPGEDLVLTTDALVEGVHFLPGAPAHSLGHRALAVNLSDIAAMGATPSWALLSLNLPQAEAAWLAAFAAGFDALARAHGVALVGGNVSRGALSITVQLAGTVPEGQALRRDGGRPGHSLYVSGSVGDAAAGLKVLRGELSVGAGAADYLRRRFEYPQPRSRLGVELRGLASACIDVSDGLYVDARRLLSASGCGGVIELRAAAALPGAATGFAEPTPGSRRSRAERITNCASVPRPRTPPRSPPLPPAVRARSPASAASSRVIGSSSNRGIR